MRTRLRFELPGNAVWVFLMVFALSDGIRANGRDSVTVGCAGAAGGPFDYSSIGAAVAALSKNSGGMANSEASSSCQPYSTCASRTITVSGTCTENVLVSDLQGIELIGTAGAMILDPGPPAPPKAVLALQRANITIRGFVLRGTRSDSLIVNVLDSHAFFDRCTIERGPTSGLWLQGLSDVGIVSSVIQDNGGWGLRVEDGSVAYVGGVFTDPIPTVIQHNSPDGVRVLDSRAWIFGNTVIQQNQGNGMDVDGGMAFVCCDVLERKITNNASAGIRVENGGRLEMFGVSLLRDNSQMGIQLIGANASLFTDAGNIRIEHNGGGGIDAQGSSHLELYTTQITNNQGPGVNLHENSSATIGTNAITGNLGGGVRVVRLSSATLFGDTITGNTGSDLFCSKNSDAGGDATGIANMSCPGFNQ